MKWENCLGIIIINEVRCADISFHSAVVDNGVIIIFEKHDSNFSRVPGVKLFRTHSARFVFVELCGIAFETLQTETGRN